MITNHKLVIGEVELISDLTSYVAYWRTRFMNCKDLSRYCTIIKGWQHFPNTESHVKGDDRQGNVAIV